MPKCDVKTRYIPATFAWTLLLSATTLFFYYPCQYYLYEYPWVPAYQGVITFFVLANFTLATFMDPGIIPKAPPDEDREDDFRAPLYKNVDINRITVRMKWCVTCKFYRPPRCSHCSVCNHCIETFDHHCPWVNNCIGRRNYRFFFFFLISLSLHMLSIFGLSLIYILNHKDDLSEVRSIVAIVLMGIVALLAIPIFGLTGFHMVLVSRGRTTNEQVTGKFKGGYNPFSRGCWNNCCYAQFGPQYPSLIKAARGAGKKRSAGQPGGAISTIANDNQVKTYMDNSNGVRNASSNAYNKLSPGRDCSSDLDADMEPGASVSADCEPTPPPLQRHGSKNNFLMAGGGSGSQQQQIQHQQQGGVGGAESPPRHPLAPRPAPYRPSPTMQQRVKALGVATPLAMSSPVRRSNPGTPTQPRRPDFISVQQPTVNVGAQYYDFPPQGRAGPSHQPGVGGYGGSPQRRFLSEGELVRQGNELSYPRTNNTVDNIRELAGSPQRGVYMWKDTSPGAYQQTLPAASQQQPRMQQQQQPPHSQASHTQPRHDYYRSNPTSPTMAQQMAAGGYRPAPVYHPALRGGVAVFPPAPPAQQSPQTGRRPQTSATIPDQRRRPMSFVRALEMSDSMEMSGAPAGSAAGPSPPTPDRTSVYDMNYEISV